MYIFSTLNLTEEHIKGKIIIIYTLIMGQSLSSDAPVEDETKFVNAKLSRKVLEQLFIKTATKLFKPIELYTLKSNLNLEDLKGDHEITKDQLFGLIQLPLDLPVSDMIFDSLKFLSYFPNFKLMDHTSGVVDKRTISVAGLIKIMVLLDSEKSEVLFGDNHRFLLLLLFLSFGFKFQDNPQIIEQKEKSNSNPANVNTPQLSNDHRKALDSHFSPSSEVENDDIHIEDEMIDVVMVNHTLQWILTPMIQSYDGIEITQYPLSAEKLLHLITFLLLISSISMPPNSIIPLSEQFDFSTTNWKKYEHRAMCLLRSFDLQLSSENYQDRAITFTAFEKIIGTTQANGTMPYLFTPLIHYLNSVLYDPQTKTIPPFENTEFKESRILTNSMLSQLATLLPSDLVFSRLRKLYIANESGFSMRQLESKIFKWNAPTILFVSGKPLDPQSSTTHKNKKYSAFQSEFPRFRKTTSTSPDLPKNEDNYKTPLTFMVYIGKPWRISNVECFGDESTFIAQLSPRQIIYGVNKSAASPNYAYFSSIGGGLGFGSKPPAVKNFLKVYRPGEISLTIESNMEVANFRQLNIPGTFQTGSVFIDHDKGVPEFEMSFQITDIEVWGCGSEKEVEEQRKRWEWENREAEARKKLNVMNWDDGKALLEMAGMIGGANNSGGSV